MLIPVAVLPTVRQDADPRVSIIIRSYKRIPALLELLRSCLAQEHDSFEIVVVEQTPDIPEALQRELDELARDPRVVVLSRPPLGPAGARNVGVSHARGTLLVFIDDDDLPGSPSWIRDHERLYDDPRCLGAVGRQVATLGEPSPYSNQERAHRRCLTFSPLLKFPRCYLRHDRPKNGIEILGGTNASLRRSAVERFGLWDETSVEGEENSFAFRLLRNKAPDEHLAFVPEAIIIRRLNVDGGLDRRRASGARQLWLHFEFAHRVIGHYFPVRFTLLYPLFLIKIVHAAATFLWEDCEYPSAGARAASVAALCALSPLYLAHCMWRLARTPAGRRYTALASR